MSTSSDPRWIGWQKQLECPCVPMEVGGGLPPDRNQLTSIFGRVDVCNLDSSGPDQAKMLSKPFNLRDLVNEVSKMVGGIGVDL